MMVIGPLSSIYDFLTCGVLLLVFRASEALFPDGVVCRVARDADARPVRHPDRRTPWRSRPSLPLAVTTIVVVLIGVMLPFTPLAAMLGFVPLPGAYFVFLGGSP
jgi:P-type Mg2+ transporter